MDGPTKKFYSENAVRISSEYVSGAPSASSIVEFFKGCQRVLDVGCGSGRDLVVLLKQGKDAYGVEAVPEMLREAVENFSRQGLSAQGRVFQAELPDLGLFQDGEFDGVLCSAVLMHLPEEQIFDAIYAIRRVLRPGGKLRVSIPAARPDVNPNTRRDNLGRLFLDLLPSKLQLLLERVGFSHADSRTTSDSLGRNGIKWWTGEFFKLNDSADRPLHLVESILNRDKKDATYKLALFRALAEIAQTQSHLAAFTPEGKVKVPLESIAEKWILYYWPIFESDVFIPQRTNERAGAGLGVANRKPLDSLIERFSKSGGLTGFYSEWKGGRLTAQSERLFQSTLRKFQSTIHTMPAKHAGGGHYSVFQHDPFDKSLCMDAALWRELCLMGSWIRDATILRWAEQTEIFAKGSVKASLVIDRLLLAPDQGRNVSEANKYFQSLSTRPCVWSLKELSRGTFAIDHAMPFSYWRNNDLWNLFPTRPEINSKKSDKLPTYSQLQISRDVIIGYWRGLNDTMGERFEREALTLLGRDAFRKGLWEPLLFSRFVEAFEPTASQRGAERWEIPGLQAAGVASEFVRPTPSSTRYAEGEEGLILREDPQGATVKILPFPDIGQNAFVTYLPIAGSLAAGAAFHGMDTGSLSDVGELDWVKVPSGVARRNRFVVRVAGNSMEPTFHIGDLLVFEYHRSPRRDREIVIANLPEFGSGSHGTEAIKRITQDPEDWIFDSDNPAYPPFRVSKSDSTHPILGTMVACIVGTYKEGR